MNLSCAMAAAADGMDVKDERLRAVAVTLEAAQRGPARGSQPSNATVDIDRHAPWRKESVLALHASRRLLARSIDMLI